MKKLICLLSVFILVSSCAPILKVYHNDDKVNGIPFYSQKSIVKQETHYLFTYKEVSFIEKTKEEKPQLVKLANRRVASSEDFTEVLKLVESLNNSTHVKSEGIKKKIIELINKKTEKEINEIDTTDVQIVGNFWKADSYIDYDNPYYINGNMPWLGTASLTQKINEKGTLSELSATTDSQVDELIGTMAGLATPISNVKIAEIGAGSGGDEDSGDEVDKNKVPKVWELKIIEKGFLYTFFREMRDVKNCDENLTREECSLKVKMRNIPPIEFDRKGHYKRINYPITTAKPKTDDKSAIKVNGSIVLPKKE